MKKSKLVLATVALATALTCTVGLAACNSDNNNENSNDSQIVAVYQLYAASAQQSGETVLTYEQWLESIKGPQGATGATGATGKSAYEIAVGNGFEGTETEWLASLKGENGENGEDGATGATGAAGKSAYEIAVENGFEGTEAEWLASLKGENGEDGATGATGVGIEGIYETSDGLMVKYTNGTVAPVQDGGVTKPLVTLGDNNLVIAVSEEVDDNFTYTEYCFYTLVGGSYKFTVYDATVSICIDGNNINYFVGDDMESPREVTYNLPAGTYQFCVYNTATVETTYRITIEKV